MTVNEWYYVKEGQRFGPLSWVEISNLAAKGMIAPEHVVWSAGMVKIRTPRPMGRHS